MTPLTIVISVISLVIVNGFSPLSFDYRHNNLHGYNVIQYQPIDETTGITTSTQLFAKTKKKKKSMAQKRKRRAQNFMPKPMERPEVLDTVPNPDEWKQTASTEEQVQAMKESEAADEKVKSQATALIDLQRRSVEVLTYVKEKVQGLQTDKVIESLTSPNGCDKVFDEFLGEELSAEMRKESLFMFDNDKMELDLSAGFSSGEYAVAIKGGEEQYADCPRITEFVVSVTRHLTQLLNEAGKQVEGEEKEDVNSKLSLEYELDEAASMAGLRTFNRKARLSSFSLLTGTDLNTITNEQMKSKDPRPFQYVIDTKPAEDEADYRKVTALYYLTPEKWDKKCGGGITIKGVDGEEKFVKGKNDRLIILSSDKCLHRMEEWLGNDDGRDSGSVIVMHFVEQRKVD